MIEYSASRTSELLLPAILSLLQQTGFILPRSGICILNTPVPFVRFTTLPKFGSSRMDITLNIDDGIAGTKKLEELFKEDWAFASHRRERARRLILFVKFFLQHHKHYGAPAKGLTGLAVSCMVIAYFKVSLPLPHFDGFRDTLRYSAQSSPGDLLLDRDDAATRRAGRRTRSDRFPRILRRSAQNATIRHLDERRSIAQLLEALAAKGRPETNLDRIPSPSQYVPESLTSSHQSLTHTHIF